MLPTLSVQYKVFKDGKLIYGAYLGLLTICVVIFFIILLITKLVFWGLSSAIIKPLSYLDKKMKQIADGNTEAIINTEIKFDKPIMEYLGIIEAYAGKDFIKEEEFCYIKKAKLIEIEKKVEQILSLKESRVILPPIKSLRYKSLKELLKTYLDYIVEILLILIFMLQMSSLILVLMKRIFLVLLKKTLLILGILQVLQLGK